MKELAKRKQKSILQSEEGTATVETVPLMFIFVALMSFTLGAFGIIHTGILDSIAARTYAFETFRGRSNVTYFRDNKNTVDFLQYRDIGTRVHAINSEKAPSGDTLEYATERTIRIGLGSLQPLNRDADYHNDKIPLIEAQKRTQTEVGPVWVITQYGICLNPSCGDQ